MVRTATAVECASCGLTTGHHEADGPPRCEECGRYAETTDDYCAEHEVVLSNLPTGYGDCPYCVRRREVDMREQEMMAQRADPRMHNSVDAPRY